MSLVFLYFCSHFFFFSLAYVLLLFFFFKIHFNFYDLCVFLNLIWPVQTCRHSCSSSFPCSQSFITDFSDFYHSFQKLLLFAFSAVVISMIDTPTYPLYLQWWCFFFFLCPFTCLLFAIPFTLCYCYFFFLSVFLLLFLFTQFIILRASICPYASILLLSSINPSKSFLYAKIHIGP